jgi:hypothetical protein
VKSKRYLFGFWTLIAIIFLRLLLLSSLYARVQKIRDDGAMISSEKIFTASNTIFLLIIAIQAFIYWLLRYKYYNKIWVRIHVCSLFLVEIIIPIVSICIIFLGSQRLGLSDFTILRITLSKVSFYAYWALLIIGNLSFLLIFFKKANTQKKEDANYDSATTILDEFITS